MKYLVIILLFVQSIACAQLSMDSAKAIIGKYRIGSYSYFKPFLQRPGYGAPWILTRDGGAAAFGSDLLYRLDKTGKEKWMRTTKAQFDENESQGVAEDTKGNLYAFMLSYDSK